MSVGKPLVFGYMRVLDDMTDEEAKQKQDGMTAYAEANGYQLAMIFHEYVLGGQSAFTDLVETVKRVEARHVIVPSYRELALTRPLQDAMTLQLTCVTQAEIISLDECP